MIRRALAAFTALAVLAFPVAAGAATEDTPVGTASTDLTLATLGIDLPEVAGSPVGDLIDLGTVLATLDLDAIDLGALRSFSSTDTDAAMNVLGDGDPFALAGVTLPLVGEVAARSDGPTTQPGQTVTLPQGLGEVTVGALAASVTDGAASSAVDLLSGELATLVGGLSVGLPADGALSLVDGEHARAANGAVLSDLSLDLTDILPLEILELLPLEVLLGLVGDLPLDLDLSNLSAELQALVAGILELADLQATVAMVSELAELREELPGLTQVVEDAKDLLDDALFVLEVAELKAELAELEQEILDLGATLLLGATVEDICIAVRALPELGLTTEQLELLELCNGRDLLIETIADLDPADEIDASVEDAETAVELAGQALKDAEQDLADLVSDIADLVTALGDLADLTLEQALALLFGLIDDLLELIDGLDLASLDLEGLRDGLVDGLAGLELLSVGEVLVGVTTVASTEGSRATALCRVEDVALLGEVKPVDTCAELQSVLAQLQVVLEDLLAGLPIVGDLALQGRSFAAVSALDGIVSVSGLTTATSPDDEEVGDYFRASAAVDALSLEVLPLELTQVVDGLVTTLTVLVDGALAELTELTGLETEELAALADIEDALQLLLAELEGLPTGDLLGGVRTAGLSLDALAVGSESTFAAASSSGPVPIGGNPPAVGTPTGPGTPQSPTSPTPTKSLPNTGGGAAGLALLMLSLGGGAAWAVRGRRG